MKFLQMVAIAMALTAFVGCGGSSDEPERATEATVTTQATDTPGAQAADRQESGRGPAGASERSQAALAGEKDGRAAPEAPSRGGVRREGKGSRAAQDPDDQLAHPPEAPISVEEVNEKLKEIEALNQRILNPPPGQTAQEAIEELRERFGQLP